LLKRLSYLSKGVTYLANPLVPICVGDPTRQDKAAARTSLGWPKDRAIVLFVGRLMIRKGVDLLLKARHPDFDLVFCGSGDPSILAELQHSPMAYMPARPRSELLVLYRAADLLAVPSRSEGGLILVCQEALTCGLSVLLGTDADLARRYEGCRGLFFCDCEPQAVQESIRALLLGTRNGRSTDIGVRSIESFHPSAKDWVKALYAAV
jgi:glycosyltransferase involved in cell wall biosynthesis